jgi:hypothetical protein
VAKESAGVPRPNKKTDFVLIFATKQAERGWRDLVATERNALADAWETLTKLPETQSELCSTLMGDLQHVIRDGESRTMWQLKLNKRSGSRIWYYVSGQTVHIERVFTSHPNATK